MPFKRKSLRKPRFAAFQKQSGRCFYCNLPTWLEQPEKFAARYSISRKQANLLQCTGEHLTSHSENGAATMENIVAACWFCNTCRHRRKSIPTPDIYLAHVKQRMRKGRWHIINYLGNLESG